MLPYLLLIFVPLLFALVAPARAIKPDARSGTLSVGVDRKIQSNSFLIPAFFVGFFLLLVLRDETIGCDVVSYHDHFDEYMTKELSEVFRARDPLYWLLNWVVGQFTDDFRWMLVVVAAIILVPIAKAYDEDREHGFLKLLLFVNLPTFVMVFSGLRQSIAMAMGLWAYQYVRKRKLIKFLIVAVLAWGFHHTAFIMFIFYPLYSMALRKKHMFLVVPSILLVFIFNQPIFMWATELLNTIFGEDYSATIKTTGAYTMLILFVMLAVFSYVIPDEKKMDKDALGLRNFMLMAVFLQCFAPVHSLAMRMNYYLILFIPMLIPKVLKCAKSNMAEIAQAAKIVMTVFFLFYYVVDTYVSCTTGVSSLNTHPYIAFWQQIPGE